MTISRIDHGQSAPSKHMLGKKLTALLAGMAVAFAGFFISNLAMAEGDNSETPVAEAKSTITVKNPKLSGLPWYV